jgi:hypothetical protein
MGFFRFIMKLRFRIGRPKSQDSDGKEGLGLAFLCGVGIAVIAGCSHVQTGAQDEQKHFDPIGNRVMSLKKHEREQLFKVWNRVWQRHEAHGWTKLTHAEQTFYAVWELESEVNHGGFQYYYFYSGGDLATNTVAALEEIGAHNLKGILLRANAIFPNSQPSRNIDDRQAYLAEKLGDKQHSIWSSLDEQVFKYPDPTEKLLWNYYLKHKKDFR